jgi:N-methylhydantoinase A
VLGYLDPDFFLGGAMRLDAAAAVDAIERDVASGLGLGVHEAAAAVLQLASEHMIRAIEEITLNQGIDPRSAILVGGGGAAGFNVVTIARRLGCPLVVMPAVGAVLSAAGALMSDLTAEFTGTLWTTSGAFDYERVNALLADLKARCLAFAEGPGAGSLETAIEFSAEARYPHQIWELDVQLRGSELGTPEDVEALRQDFHRVHREVFAIADVESPIEIVAWRARVRCRIREEGAAVAPAAGEAVRREGTRQAFFPGLGLVETSVLAFEGMEVGRDHAGPAVVESPVTTVVIDADASVQRTGSGNLVIVPHAGAAGTAPMAVERGAA